MNKILILEDEIGIRSFLVKNLNRLGYEVIEASTCAEADEQLKLHPDIKVAILDRMLPDGDGIEICRKIQTAGSNIVIVMLSAKAQEMERIEGLMTGADYYITKPLPSTAEFTAQIEAIFRRMGPADPGVLVQGPFKLNTNNRVLDKDGTPIRLTEKECDIMKMLMENPGKVLSREDILNKVWGRDYVGEDKTPDVNIRRLRVKIEDDPENPTYITAVRGIGYQFGL